MIEVKGLCRSFGNILAVDHLDFKVSKGELLGFLGPNGAGKSTTMKMLTCFLTPSAGTANIGGYDILESPDKVREIVGYLPENAPLYGEMKVIDFLRFISEVRGLDYVNASDSIDKVIASTSLEQVLEQRIETLSKGFKRRVGLAQAILHDPQILILDEPTDGLDPNQKHEVRKLIKSMSKDKCIIISTHILEEVDAVCTRAMIISKGKLLADGTPEELREKSTLHNSIKIYISKQNESKAMSILDGLSEVKDVLLAEDGCLIVSPRDNRISFVKSMFAEFENASIPIQDMRTEIAHLDEVFRQITQNNLNQ